VPLGQNPLVRASFSALIAELDQYLFFKSSEMGIFLSLPRCDRGESKLLPLLGPAKRNMLVEVFELQLCRLTSLENGFDDIRAKNAHANTCLT
jgi:hypothetical protein